MSILLTRIVEQLIYPPSSTIVLVAVGLWLLRRRPVWGKGLIAAGVIVLYLGSIPLTNLALASLLERYPALRASEVAAQQPQALVVLGGGRYPQAPEYGGSTSGPSEVERLRFATLLHRVTKVPIAVIGGDPFNTGIAEADLMARVLENEFRVPVRWRDGRSRSTIDNARFAWELLQQQGISRIALITHAWHMPRSVEAFSREGFTVIPSPTAFTTLGQSENGLLAFIPSAKSLYRTHRALHEIVGIVWYRLFY